jgi:hypothetical protein
VTRTAYYAQMKALAAEVRATHGLATPKVTLTDLRRIYKHYGIKIDYWDHPLKAIRGAYFNDELGPHVMVAKKLPEEQRIFTLAHELKHHLTQDDPALHTGEAKEVKEIGAELFAVELIFPEADFRAAVQYMGIGQGDCTAETIVRLKHDTSTTLSYGSMAKRAEFLGYAAKGSLKDAKWHSIRDGIYGEPPYKAILRRRQSTQRV